MKSHSLPIPIILAISREITPKFANFSLKITKNRKNCHSRISRFPQMVKREIIFMLDSRKCWSRSFTSHNYVWWIMKISSCLKYITLSSIVMLVHFFKSNEHILTSKIVASGANPLWWTWKLTYLALTIIFVAIVVAAYFLL